MNTLIYELYTRPRNIQVSGPWHLICDFRSNAEAVDAGRYRQSIDNPTLEFRVVSSEDEETHFEDAIAD